MAQPTMLESTIRKIVNEGDINQLTINIIVQRAEDILQTDLKEKKKQIKEILNNIITELGSAEADNSTKEKPSTDTEQKETKKETKSEKPSKSVSSIEAETGLTRGEIEAQRLLYEAFKAGSRGTRQTRSSSNPVKRRPPKKSKKRQKRVVDSDDDNKNEDEKQTKAPKKRRASGLTKPAVLSAELAEFLGAERLPRTEVVKRLNAYVKEHNLQNPKNRKQIFFDEKLKAVFKVSKSDFFKINKLISKHVKPANEVVGEGMDDKPSNEQEDVDIEQENEQSGNESNEENKSASEDAPKTESTEDKQPL